MVGTLAAAHTAPVKLCARLPEAMEAFSSSSALSYIDEPLGSESSVALLIGLRPGSGRTNLITGCADNSRARSHGTPECAVLDHSTCLGRQLPKCSRAAICFGVAMIDISVTQADALLLSLQKKVTR